MSADFCLSGDALLELDKRVSDKLRTATHLLDSSVIPIPGSYQSRLLSHEARFHTASKDSFPS